MLKKQSSRPGRRVRRISAAKLSRREIVFLQVTAEGNSAREISEQLEVTERTANFHINNAKLKLGAKNKTHAVVLAMRMGLLK